MILIVRRDTRLAVHQLIEFCEMQEECEKQRKYTEIQSVSYCVLVRSL